MGGCGAAVRPGRSRYHLSTPPGDRGLRDRPPSEAEPPAAVGADPLHPQPRRGARERDGRDPARAHAQLPHRVAAEHAAEAPFCRSDESAPVCVSPHVYAPNPSPPVAASVYELRMTTVKSQVRPFSPLTRPSRRCSNPSRTAEAGQPQEHALQETRAAGEAAAGGAGRRRASCRGSAAAGV